MMGQAHLGQCPECHQTQGYHDLGCPQCVHTNKGIWDRCIGCGKPMPLDETKMGIRTNKFSVRRTDGSSNPGCRHENCSFFVLDWEHDQFAPTAAYAYAEACAEEYPKLAEELRTKAEEFSKKWKDT